MNAEKTNHNTLKLYGTIHSGDGAAIVQAIEQMSRTQSHITLHVHSPGGSTIDGSLVFNAIVQSQSHFHVIVDGLAASMASIIMCAADKVSIVQNGLVMIHAPSAVATTATQMKQYANLLEGITEQFVHILHHRTSKPEDEVKEWMQGTHWFTASQAKAHGLVDEVVQLVIPTQVIQSMKGKDIAALQDSFPTGIGEEVTESHTKPPTDKAETDQPQTELPTDKAESTEPESDLPTDKSEIEEPCSDLPHEVGEVGEVGEVESVVTKAVEDKRILGANARLYHRIGRDYGIEALESLLPPVTPAAAPSLYAMVNTQDPTATSRGWDWDTWQQRDPQGLESMCETNFDAFDELYREKFGQSFSS